MKALQVRWPTASPKSLFGERKERSLRTDVHLTPSQKFGVVSQQEYMELSGGRVVLNLTSSDKMKHVEPGDFIIHLRSFQGGLERSSLQGKVSPAYTVLHPRSALSDRFYQWVFWSDWYIGELASTVDQLRDGQSINYRTFIRTVVPIPPISEQKIIADFLDRETARLDALVEAQTKLIATLKERRGALIAGSIMGNGKVVALRSDGPPSPTSRSIKHFAEFVNGSPFKPSDLGDDGYPVIRIAQLLDPAARIDMAEPPAQPVWIEEGDLVFSWSATLAARIWDRGPALLNQHLFRVDPVAGIDTTWLRYALEVGIERLVVLMHGSAMTHITRRSLGSLLLDPPPLGKQRRIADFLDAETAKIDALIEKAEEFIEVAKERRSALITAAVTGQIDVKEMVV